MCKGVGDVSLFLSAEGLSQEDIFWFNLYTQLLGALDTKKYDRNELALLMTRYLHDGNITDTCLRDPEGEGFTPYLSARWYSLDEDLADSYGLVSEILYHTVLNDAESILDTIAGIKATYKQSLAESVYQLQYTRAAAATDPMTAYILALNGLDYFQFLSDVEERIAEDPDASD